MDLDTLSEQPLFSGLEKDELKTLTETMEKLSFHENDHIFQKDDPGGTMYVVLVGEVQINASIAPGLKKSLLHVPAGGVFGELSLFSLEDRSAEAVAVTDTELLSLDTQSLQKILADTPAAGAKLLTSLTTVISDRLRGMTDMYCQALDWSLSVSGAIELHMDQLISNSVNLTVRLSNGESRRGRLLKVEEHAAGFVIFLQSEDGELELIPYHAVISMTFDKGAVQIRPREDLL